MTIKMNMKNPLWQSHPARAKRQFEKELREMLTEPEGLVDIGWNIVIKEILGK